MKKGKKFNLMAMFFMAIMVVLSGCEKLTDNMSSTEDKDGPVDPVLEDLNFTLDRQEWNRGWNYESLWTAAETTTNTVEKGRLYTWCSHESDRYAVAEKYRNISADYSNSHMTVGAVDTKVSGTSDRHVFSYKQRFTAETECGNLLYLDWEGERIYREFDGKFYGMPADSLKSARIKAINTLPGNTKYNRTRGDEYVSDSVCREVVWDLTLTSVGLATNQEFHQELRDTFRVLLLSANDIAEAYVQNKQRVVLNETEEKCSFNEIFKMKDGTEHSNPHSIILTREIITIPEYEKIVKDFEFKHLSDGNVQLGTVSTVSTKDNWTVTERTDAFSGLASNGIEPINTDYKFRHQGARYKDDYVDVDFELITPTMAERSTWVENATSPRGGYTAMRFQNTIQTSYLGYSQDAGESVLLLKEQAHIINEYWDKSHCTETITDSNVKWHLEFVTDYSDGTQDRKKFDFQDGRLLECDSNWDSDEEDNTHSTSGVNATIASRENQTAEQDGAVAKWVREYRNLVSVVTLKGSTQNNKWHSVEPNSFECTYKGKTFRFEDNTLTVSNTDNLSEGVEKDNQIVYSYSALLRYVWGSNIKNSSAPGVIRVAKTGGKEDTFFPEEWGELYEAKQTVSNNPRHDGFVYVWSLHFRKGVLPVVVPSGSTPDWNFAYFEYTDIHTYNSGTYVDGVWVNTIASDQITQMTWSRGNVEKANKDYNVAKSQNWDEGRLVNRHASTTTSRYLLEVKDGRLSATDTYTSTYLGSWK